MLLYVLILKVCYLFFKLLPSKNQVLLMSRRNSKNSIEFTSLIKEIKSRYEDTKIITLNHNTDNRIKTLLNSFIEAFYIAQSRYVIVDSYIIPVSVLKHKRGTRIIQVWHAIGAIKKFGYGSINKSSGSTEAVAKTMKMHRGYDYIIAGSAATIDIYHVAFDTPKDKIIPLGTPTIDYLLDPIVNKPIVSAIQSKYNLASNKEIILYAPTFRNNKRVEMSDLLSKFDTSKYTVVVKAHPLDTVQSGSSDIIFDNHFSTTDWLFVADRVISDYSAVIFEASVLELPLYHYIYDFKDYSEDPGLFMDYYTEMPGVISTYGCEIVKAISDKTFDAQKAYDFKQKYVATTAGTSTKQIVDLLYKE